MKKIISLSLIILMAISINFADINTTSENKEINISIEDAIELSKKSSSIIRSLDKQYDTLYKSYQLSAVRTNQLNDQYKKYENYIILIEKQNSGLNLSHDEYVQFIEGQYLFGFDNVSLNKEEIYNKFFEPGIVTENDVMQTLATLSQQRADALKQSKLTIMTYYQQLLIMYKQEELLHMKLEYSLDNIKTLKYQSQLGTISINQYKKAEIAHDQLESQMLNLEHQKANLMDQFKILLNLPIETKVHLISVSLSNKSATLESNKYYTEYPISKLPIISVYEKAKLLAYNEYQRVLNYYQNPSLETCLIKEIEYLEAVETYDTTVANTIVTIKDKYIAALRSKFNLENAQDKLTKAVNDLKNHKLSYNQGTMSKDNYHLSEINEATARTEVDISKYVYELAVIELTDILR